MFAGDGTSVTVGLLQGFYTASEDSGSIQVCVGVLSGELIEGLTLDYTTVDGSAEGIIIHWYSLSG